LFTKIVFDFLISGGRLPARRPVSGCELGRPPRAGVRSDAREDAIARNVARPAVDNNLIAVGVSRILPRLERVDYTGADIAARSGSRS
jgi:hypothetical protein